ncbi:hypothetical protein EZS27_027381 [termite gut metagenome]|uniref:Uncharacterized protein n=1 Tax=termite gut metagenome TaxID=433724 RepID=A0A5J4QQ42_9ZZZZ
MILFYVIDQLNLQSTKKQSVYIQDIIISLISNSVHSGPETIQNVFEGVLRASMFAL